MKLYRTQNAGPRDLVTASEVAAMTFAREDHSCLDCIMFERREIPIYLDGEGKRCANLSCMGGNA